MSIDAISTALDIGFDGLILVFGLGALWHAVSVLSHQQTLREREPVETGSVGDDELVAVEGEIRGPTDDELTSPFRRQRGVVAKWSVEEYVGHDAAPGGGWREFGSGYEAVPFLVDDGSGAVAVEITGEESLRRLELELSEFGDDPAFEVDVTERPPRHVREFVEANDVRDRQSETSAPTTESGPEQGDRRYYETVLGSGDRVYVVGYASESGDGSRGSAAATVSPPPDGADGTFYLSDRPRSAALRQRLSRAAVTGGLGIFLTWYGVSEFVPGAPFP